MDNVKTKAACNFFIKKAQEEGRFITPMQAIKLVYIAHGYSLAILNHPLIDDHVEAWKFGAVIPSLYHSLKVFGSDRITAPILDSGKVDYFDALTLTPEDLTRKYPNAVVANTFSTDELQILCGVWEVYKNKSGFDLSALIHQPGTPWTRVWEGRGKYTHGAIIDDSLIKEHYLRLIAPADE